jgi:N utilization substance protein A
MDQLEEEKGVSKDAVFEAIETSLAAAYKKEYGRRGQIIRAAFDIDTGTVEFSQVKIVVDEDTVRVEEEGDEEEGSDEPAILVSKAPKVAEKKDGKTEKTEESEDEEDPRVKYNPEHHIFLEDAKKIKKDAELEDEIIFQLEERDDFGRIAAQTAKQVIIQKIREAERTSVLEEFGQREGEIVSGHVDFYRSWKSHRNHGLRRPNSS